MVCVPRIAGMDLTHKRRAGENKWSSTLRTRDSIMSLTYYTWSCTFGLWIFVWSEGLGLLESYHPLLCFFVDFLGNDCVNFVALCI